MTAERITWIAVADGQKALILRNHGSDFSPSLAVVSAEEIDNPPSREQAADRPGRSNDGRSGSARKSAFDEGDYHALAKEEFARDFARKLNRAAAKGVFDRVAVFAPPSTLGELRAHYEAPLKDRLIGEFGRDLVKHPVAEIERQVAVALKGA